MIAPCVARMVLPGSGIFCRAGNRLGAPADDRA
jgi:hypothetical protein